MYDPSHPRPAPNKGSLNGNFSNISPAGNACLNQPKISNNGNKVINVAGNECLKYFMLFSIVFFCISNSFCGSFLNFFISSLKNSDSSFKVFITFWFVKNFMARLTIKVKIKEITKIFNGLLRLIIGPKM